MTKAEYEALIKQAVAGQLISLFGVLMTNLAGQNRPDDAEVRFEHGLRDLTQALNIALSKAPKE
jgi:hypothetical protein